MSRIFLYVVSVLLAAPSLAEPVTVQSCDRTVTFDQPPAAAVSNDVNLTEMMLVLGLKDRMVGYTGVSGWSRIDERFKTDVADLPELSAKYPSKEVLVGAGADFYFAGWNYGLEVGGEVTPDSLRPFGIQVYELTESCIHVGKKSKISMDDLYSDLLKLGVIFGVRERAEGLVEAYKSELHDLTANLIVSERPIRVFVYDSGESVPFTAGRYAMPTALIEAAGGKNVIDDLDKSWSTVGWETVIERNPEIVVIINYGDVTAGQKRKFMISNPALAEIDAVKNDRFVVLEYVEATPGHRNIDAIKKLVEAFWGQ